MTAPALRLHAGGRPRLTEETPYPCGHPRTAANTGGKGCRTCRRAVNARHYEARTTRHLVLLPPSPKVSPAVAALIEECRPEYLAAVEELSGQLDLGLLFAAFPRRTS